MNNVGISQVVYNTGLYLIKECFNLIKYQTMICYNHNVSIKSLITKHESDKIINITKVLFQQHFQRHLITVVAVILK